MKRHFLLSSPYQALWMWSLCRILTGTRVSPRNTSCARFSLFHKSTLQKVEDGNWNKYFIYEYISLNYMYTSSKTGYLLLCVCVCSAQTHNHPTAIWQNGPDWVVLTWLVHKSQYNTSAKTPPQIQTSKPCRSVYLWICLVLPTELWVHCDGSPTYP